MKNAFYASLCHEGLRGGAIALGDDAIRYKNQTLTMEEEYKNMNMPLQEIEKLETGTKFLLPTVTIRLKNQKSYRFVIFNRKRFLKELQLLGIKTP